MNEQVHSSGTALYYPYIHVRRPEHVKAALFYWDRVRRIVPNDLIRGSVYVRDERDKELIRFADEELLLPTPAEPYSGAAEEKFFDFVKRIEKRPDRDDFIVDEQAARALERTGGGIHVEKIGESTRRRLEAMKFARRRGDWVMMREELGAAYMLSLASVMSDRIGAPLFTDTPEAAHPGEIVHFDANDNADDTNQMLLRLGIDMPRPAELVNVSVPKIVKFCRRRRDERRRFRHAIESLMEGLRAIKDPHALDDHISDRRVEIEEAVADLGKASEELGIDKLRRAATISMPALAGTALGLLTNPLAGAVVAGVGYAIEVVQWVAESRGKSRALRHDAPYHYLSAVEAAIGRPVVGSSIGRRRRR